MKIANFTAIGLALTAVGEEFFLAEDPGVAVQILDAAGPAPTAALGLQQLQPRLAP